MVFKEGKSITVGKFFYVMIVIKLLLIDGVM